MWPWSKHVPASASASAPGTMKKLSTTVRKYNASNNECQSRLKTLTDSAQADNERHTEAMQSSQAKCTAQMQKSNNECQSRLKRLTESAQADNERHTEAMQTSNNECTAQMQVHLTNYNRIRDEYRSLCNALLDADSLGRDVEQTIEDTCASALDRAVALVALETKLKELTNTTDTDEITSWAKEQFKQQEDLQKELLAQQHGFENKVSLHGTQMKTVQTELRRCEKDKHTMQVEHATALEKLTQDLLTCITCKDDNAQQEILIHNLTQEMNLLKQAVAQCNKQNQRNLEEGLLQCQQLIDQKYKASQEENRLLNQQIAGLKDTVTQLRKAPPEQNKEQNKETSNMDFITFQRLQQQLQMCKQQLVVCQSELETLQQEKGPTQEQLRDLSTCRELIGCEQNDDLKRCITNFSDFIQRTGCMQPYANFLRLSGSK